MQEVWHGQGIQGQDQTLRLMIPRSVLKLKTYLENGEKWRVVGEDEGQVGAAEGLQVVQVLDQVAVEDLAEVQAGPSWLRVERRERMTTVFKLKTTDPMGFDRFKHQPVFRYRFGSTISCCFSYWIKFVCFYKKRDRLMVSFHLAEEQKERSN